MESEKSKKQKIAFLLPQLIKTAPILYNRNLTDQLIEYFDITVFYFKGKDNIGFNCKTILIDFYKDYNFEGFDLVQSFGYKPDIFLSRNRSRITAKLITTLHSFIFFDLRSQFGFIASLIFGSRWLYNLRKFDQIICLTNVMRDYYAQYLPSYKLNVIKSSRLINSSKEDDKNQIIVNQITDFKSNKILVGIFANVTYQKGIDHVIKAISSSDKFQLVILGDGNYLKKLKKLVSIYQCESKCLFLGHIPNAHLYMSLLDIYIMSSYQEGFGLVGLEAAHYKIPLVCNNIPVFREIYSTEVVEFYDSNSSQSLIRALENVAISLEEYGLKLNEYCRSAFNMVKMAKEYNQLYKGLI
jgi:glycosyltransferase involved in cell wall biosynthesis